MAKFRVEAKFYCYLDEAGMQKHVLKKADLETEEVQEEEDDQVELSLDPEDPFALGKVFSSMDSKSKKITDYFKITSVEGDNVKCRDAKHDADYVFTRKQMAEDIIEGRLIESIQKLYDAMANGEIEENFVDPYPVGTIFSVFYPTKKKAYNYVEVISVVGNSLAFRSAEDGSQLMYTEEQVKAKLETKEFYSLLPQEPRKTLAELYNGLGLANQVEETEAPVTADGTTVEEAVNKAIKDLVGHLDQPLVLSASDKGIWSNKILDGDIEICKDEVHDLLNAEADGLRAVFVLTLKDKK